MSYPDEWNHIGQSPSTPCKTCNGTTKRLAPNPPFAGWIESDIGTCPDCCKFHKAAAHPPAKFKKALVVVADDFVVSRAIMPSVYEADIVITESGKLLKSTCTKIPVITHSDVLEQMATALELLSGDLNHDNVAQAKEILKSLIV